MITNNVNPIDEENIKNLRKASNEIEKAFGDYIKMHPELAEATIAVSIDRLTTVLHNDLEKLIEVISNLKNEREE